MKIPLLRGRWFSSADREDSPVVVVINETAAQRYWPGEDPVGKRIGLGFSSAAHDFNDGAEVIGVVGDVSYGKPDEPPPPDAYVSTSQMMMTSMTLLVRTTSNPLSLTDAIRREVHELDKERPIYDIQTLEQLFADSTAQARFIAILLTAFAAIAFALAGIGIYGVMSYMVRQRTREIGIRMALGARRGDVRRMIVLRAAALALAGMAAGLAGAFAVTRLLRAALFEVKATDPQTYLLVSGMLIFLAAFSSYIPASRASRIDPCVSLRSE
jgi:putative ABC transport system permease protein